MSIRNLNSLKPKSLFAVATAALVAAGLTLAPAPAHAAVRGWVDAGDTHRHTVFLAAGQAEEIAASGDGDIDLEVRCPEHGVVIASDHEDDGVPVCIFVAPETGTYTIVVRNNEYHGVAFDLSATRL